MNYVLQGGTPSPATSAPTPTATTPRAILPAAGGMFVWENGPTTGATPGTPHHPPPLLLPPPTPTQTPTHIQPPTLQSLPPPPSVPAAPSSAVAGVPPPTTPAAGYLPSNASAVAAAVAAAGGSVRPPPFPGAGLAAVPNPFLPPSNGLTMIPSVPPNVKHQPPMLLPPIAGTPRPNLEATQVSHSNVVSPVKNTAAVSSAGYPSNVLACYPTPSLPNAISPHNPAAASPGMFIFSTPNSSLPTSLTSMPPQVPFFSTFPQNVTDTSATSKPSPLHLLPTPYNTTTIPPPQRRPPSTTTSSVTTKRSYDQAFSNDRTGSSAGGAGGSAAKSSGSSSSAGISGSSVGGTAAKRIATGATYPTFPPPTPTAAHFPQSSALHQLTHPHHLAAAATPAPSSLTAATGGLINAAFAPAALNPMGVIPGLYPPHRYPSM